MDDPPRSRSLRLLLGGLLLILVWGFVAPVAAEAPIETTTSDVVTRARGLRVASPRPSFDSPDLIALPAREPTFAEVVTCTRSAERGGPRVPARQQPIGRASLPRAPPPAWALSA